MMNHTDFLAHTKARCAKAHRAFPILLLTCWLLGVLWGSCFAASTFSLETPSTSSITVHSQFRITGRSQEPELMLSLRRTGTVPTMVYAQQRVLIHQGRFDTWVWLPWGSGEYEVGIWRWDGTRHAFMQLSAFRVVNVEAIPSSAVQAPPALMWGFNPTLDRVSLPSRTYMEADGTVPLRLHTTHSRLMVTLTKDGVVSRYVIPVYKGEVATTLWLARGSGRYDITLWYPEKEGTYIPWVAFAVNNRVQTRYEDVNEAPRWFDAAWKNNTSLLEITQLEALAGGHKGVPDGKLVLRGKSNYPYLVASVERGGEKVRYRMSVAKDGSFSVPVWLRFGRGIHIVTVWADTKGNGDLTALVQFAANMASDINIRYLAPSLGVESDHPRVVSLARELVKPGMTDRQAARAIHDWVAQYITYDMEKYRSGTYTPDEGALKTLETRRGICQDFSYLTVALLRAAGIPARIAVGQAQGYSFGGQSGWEPHAWAEAYVEGRWLIIDTTWDAGYITPQGQFVRRVAHTYFDPASAEFGRQHRLLRYDY